jgi:hypothetical protein
MPSIQSPEMPASLSYASPTPHPQCRSSFGSDRTSTTVIPPAHQHQHQRSPSYPRPQKAALSQRAIFRAAAPPLLYSFVIAGLLIELRARLASPLPEAPPGLAISVQGNTITQRALIWAEIHWPGPWLFLVLCLGALGALRASILACAIVLDSFEERVGVSGAAGVRIGRWEDGGSVSGSELLAGMFT